MSAPKTKHTRCPECQWEKNLQSVTWLTCAACREAYKPACPHGIPHEMRKRDGCRKCDAESHDEFLAAQEAAKFRVRVIQTARAILPQMAGAWLVAGHADSNGPTHDAFRYAEAFERAADEYLKG